MSGTRGKQSEPSSRAYRRTFRQSSCSSQAKKASSQCGRAVRRYEMSLGEKEKLFMSATTSLKPRPTSKQ